MSPNVSNLTGRGLAEEVSRNIKKRVKTLLLVSTLAVALAFGLSFYFALISNESAIARQVPELEAVVSKLKSLMIINTFGFAAIIIGSLYILSRLVTARIFRPLGFIGMDLLAMGKGKLPAEKEIEEEGTFSSLEGAFKTAVTALRERESRELKGITDCLEILSDSQEYLSSVVSQKLEEIAKGKNDFLGTVHDEAESKVKEKEPDPLFMQPV